MNNPNLEMEAWSLRKTNSFSNLKIQWPWSFHSFPTDLAQNIIDKITQDYPELYLIEHWTSSEEKDPLLENINGIKVSTRYGWDEFYRGPPTYGMVYHLGKAKIMINYPLVRGSMTGNTYDAIFSNKDDIMKNIVDYCNSSNNPEEWKRKILEKGEKIILQFSEELFLYISISNLNLNKFPFKIRTEYENWEFKKQY
jgi:hypothetical protein